MSLLRRSISPLLRLRASALLARTSITKRGAAQLPLPDVEHPKEDHSFHFVFERYWAIGIFPLVPLGYFYHTPTVDAILTIAIALHAHWGISGVVSDYARPFVIGDTLAKLARTGVYVITILMLAGLLHFNNTDIGLTKAFELFWTL